MPPDPSAPLAPPRAPAAPARPRGGVPEPAAGLAGAIAALGQSGFAAALDGWLCAALGADNIVVIAFPHPGGALALHARAPGPEVFAGLHTRYLTGAYLLDPFHALHLARAPAGAYRLRDIAPDQFQRSEYFRDYYGRTGLTDEIAFVVPTPGATLNVCMGRSGGAGRAAAFPARSLAEARRIAPVVEALCLRQWGSLAPAAGGGTEGALVPRLVDAAAQGLGVRLTPRQAEVALLILRGHSSVSIGLQLGISVQTVKVLRKQLYRRCAISSQAELFALMSPLLRDTAGG